MVYRVFMCVYKSVKFVSSFHVVSSTEMAFEYTHHMYSVRCKLYTVQCTLYNMKYTWYSVNTQYDSFGG